MEVLKWTKSILFRRRLPYYQTDGKILFGEGKNKPSQWAKLHAVFLAVMEEGTTITVLMLGCTIKQTYGW